jgi:hypothetical protein
VRHITTCTLDIAMKVLYTPALIIQSYALQVRPKLLSELLIFTVFAHDLQGVMMSVIPEDIFEDENACEGFNGNVP